MSSEVNYMFGVSTFIIGIVIGFISGWISKWINDKTGLITKIYNLGTKKKRAKKKSKKED